MSTWYCFINETTFITARKRSLRRLCFYRCLSVHKGGVGWGFSIRGGFSIQGGFSIRVEGGFSIRGEGGFSIWGGSPSRGGLHPVNVQAVRILLECILVQLYALHPAYNEFGYYEHLPTTIFSSGFLYIRANAIFFFDLLPLAHRCSVNAHIGNNTTDEKRHRFRFRSNINAP